MLENKTKIKNIVFQLASILIIVAAICYAFAPLVAPYIMIVGAIAYIICVFISRYKGPSLRGKRLYNILAIAAILVGAASYLMYVQDLRWALLLFISAILTLYATIMLDKVIKKDAQN